MNSFEKKFLDILDEYGKIFPDEIHIIKENRQERMRRFIVSSSYEECQEIKKKLTSVLVDLTTHMTNIKTNMSYEWSICFYEASKDILEVVDIFQENLALKVN
jgi:endonuclease III-like uncharacterized protein